MTKPNPPSFFVNWIVSYFFMTLATVVAASFIIVILAAFKAPPPMPDEEPGLWMFLLAMNQLILVPGLAAMFAYEQRQKQKNGTRKKDGLDLLAEEMKKTDNDPD